MNTVLPRSTSSEFDVVLTGAGISIDAPAELPSAAQLVDEVWTTLCKSLGGLVDADLQRKRVRPQLEQMRMEQFLEILSGPGGIPTRILVNVYQLVGGAAYNENHLRLATLDATHFTLNMDTLIEDAAPGIHVVHLHGVWNRPRSIRTTVTHYSKGLSRRLRARFGMAIRGKSVLVIGYSGRDTDVIPLFDEYPPKKITWVGPNVAGWEAEVQTLKRRYDSTPDSDFTAVGEKAGEYLPKLVPNVPAATGTKLPHPPTNLDRDLATKTTRAQRVIAVARLLFDMGLNEDLRRILEGESFVGGSEITRRKILARSWNRDGEARRALALLLQQPESLGEALAWPGNLNEIAAVASRASRPHLSRRIQTLVIAVGYAIPTRAMRRRRMLVQVRIAKNLAVRGDVRKAIALADRATGSRRARYVLGESSLVDALTWHADALKDVGELADAEAKAELAVRSINYSDHSQAAYALWKYAEIRLVAGPKDNEDASAFEADIEEHLKKAVDEATLGGVRDTLAWVHGTWAEHLVSTDAGSARAHLNAAASNGALDPSRGPLGRSYHLLQRSVVEMAEGHLTEAANSATAAQAVAEGGDIPAAALQARQLLAEIRWQIDQTSPLADQLDALAAEYAARDLPLNEARARTTASVLRGDAVPTSVVH
ncbi:MAG: SIR2 family protein, partial [Cumulibacter sp.]